MISLHKSLERSVLWNQGRGSGFMIEGSGLRVEGCTSNPETYSLWGILFTGLQNKV